MEAERTKKLSAASPFGWHVPPSKFSGGSDAGEDDSSSEPSAEELTTLVDYEQVMEIAVDYGNDSDLAKLRSFEMKLATELRARSPCPSR